MGGVSHMTADVSWHSLAGVTQGFIPSMAAQNFHGNYSQAHSAADTGGETMLSFMFDLDYVTEDWSMPLEDIKKIYTMLNMSIPDDRFVEGSLELFLASIAIKEGGDIAYPKFASESPFLVDQYLHFPLGGLDDMALWTTRCWDSMLRWLEEGPDEEICLMLIYAGYMWPPHHQHTGTNSSDESPCGPRGCMEDNKAPAVLDDRQAKQRADLMKRVKIYTSQNGEVVFSLPKKERSSYRPALDLNLAATSARATFTTASDYSYLGTGLAVGDLNKDSIDDVVYGAIGIGAQQAGCVYVTLGSRDARLRWNGTSTDAFHSANVTLCGSSFGLDPGSRFGWSITLLDFNLDGIMDVVVGAPSAGNAEMVYGGSVMVFYGHMTSPSVPASWKLSSVAPDIIISSQAYFTNFGLVLTNGDCNEDGHLDLIVGSPLAAGGFGSSQGGSVSVFLSSKKYINRMNMTENNANWVAKGGMEGQWFGQSVVMINSFSGRSGTLVVGSPGFSSGGYNANGKIFGYQMGAHEIAQHTVKVVFTLVGTTQFSYLGESLAVGRPFASIGPVLAVSMPGYNITRDIFFDVEQAGRVLLFDVTLLQGDLSIAKLKPLTTFNGRQIYSRFGKRLLFNTFHSNGTSDGLVISEPLDGLVEDHNFGVVYSWKAGAVPQGNVTDITSSASYIFYKQAPQPPLSSSSSVAASSSSSDFEARFGYNIALGDVDGDGVADLIVGSNRDNSVSYLGGSLTVIFA
eukprot:TRINITY_DN1856_c0_g1_i3.p1 TRINITY_DN1856_c0_g1~~TRINITY_DN1856_c0_g1_i3.p1  ORF type:complete len:741 (-),score=181.77 TRINITY_DN1856_c0_g1_i3:262-2484(-)